MRQVLDPMQKTEWTMPELNRRPFTGRISHHVILSDDAEAKMRSENHTTRPIALVAVDIEWVGFLFLLHLEWRRHDSRHNLGCRHDVSRREANVRTSPPTYAEEELRNDNDGYIYRGDRFTSRK